MFNFGNPSTSVPLNTSTSLSTGFSLPKSSAPGSISFGTPASSTFAATTAATKPLGFGLPTSGALTGFSLGSTPATTTSLFGTASSAPTATSGSSLGFSFGTKPIGSVSGFSLTTPSVVSSAPTIGLGGTVPSSVGLGGVATTTSSGVAITGGTGGGKSDAKATKETLLPNEIYQITETFKKHIKEQKQECEHISRVSAKPMYKVEEETAALHQMTLLLSNSIQKHVAAVNKLKTEVGQELKNAEMAQRTQDIPAGLQYDNTAPTEYFLEMAGKFEASMQIYRQQIDQLERLVVAAGPGGGLVTPEELSLLMRRLYQTFVSLAGQLHSLHEKAKQIRDQFLLHFRHLTVAGETHQVVFKSDRKSGPQAPTTTRNLDSTHIAGPSPFSGIPHSAAVAMAATISRSQQVVQSPSIGTPVNALSYISGGSLGFTLPTAGKSSDLQLPQANKRGKR